MSLDKTKARLLKIRAQNRALRTGTLAQLTEPGPWYPIPFALQYDPSFFLGLTEQQTGIDTPPAK